MKTLFFANFIGLMADVYLWYVSGCNQGIGIALCFVAVALLILSFELTQPD